MNMSNSICDHAESYFKAGLKPLPTGTDKRPIWRGKGVVKRYREKEISIDLAPELFGESPAISILTGQCSGNLEVIDIDTKNDVDGNLEDLLWNAFHAHVGDLADNLPLVRTKSGGYHLYYRCEEIEGNQKLAARPPTDGEKANDENVGDQVLIETRGEGGYVVAPPSDGYTLEAGDLESVPTITPQQREGLLMAARSLDRATIEEARKMVRNQPQNESGDLRPGDDYNERADVEDVLNILYGAGWSESYRAKDGNKVYLLRPGNPTSKTSGNFDIEERVLFVFSTSTSFKFTGACGGFKPFDIYTKILHGGDYSAAARELSAKGFGQKKPKNTHTESTDNDGATDGKLETFWAVIQDSKGKNKVVFSRIKFISWLESEGFGRYHYAPGNWTLVRHDNNIVEKVPKDELKQYTMDYMDSLPFEFDNIYRIQLMEMVAKGVHSYFSDDLLEFLQSIDIDTHRDTPNVAYLYYKNCVVKRTKKSLELIQYADIDGYVWKEQIIERNFKIVDNYLNDYYRFVWIVCGCKDKGQSEEQLQRRINAVERVIGFAMHSYKDPVNCPTIMIYDETQDSENPEGGTGKGIFLNGLAYLKKMCKIGGKLHSLESTFAFQRVDVDTQILVFEDVKKGWDFEKIFSITTEGLTVEKKNKDSFFIPFAKSPKIFVTSNYPIAGQGSSHERRRLELEFNGYFRDTPPFEHFGHRLFDDWSEDDWLRFDNYIVYCLGEYLENGLVKPPIVNLDERKLKSRTHPQFVEFIRGWLEMKRYSYKDVHDGLNGFNRDFEKYNQTTITRWANTFVKHEGIEIKKVKVNDGFRNVNGFEVLSIPKYNQKAVTTLGKNKVVDPETKVDKVVDPEPLEDDENDTLPF